MKQDHFFKGSSPSNILRTAWKYGKFSFTSWLQILAIFLFAIFRSSYSRREARVLATKLDAASNLDSPIFIIGHWRSGTTLLHNIMARDPQFNYLRIRQAIIPWDFFCINERHANYFARRLPEFRPMDQIRLSPESPAEESLSLANMTTMSFYHLFYFPKQMTEVFKRSVLLDVTEKERQGWKDNYMYIIRKLGLCDPGKQLLLKDPSHTAHISILLELFPDAKFIHLHRNPYDVFVSTKFLYVKMVDRFGFQKLPRDYENHILSFYKALMGRYLEEKNLVPSSNLLDISFEDLEANAILEMSRVYDSFNLRNWHQVKPKLEEYLALESGYKKNEFRISDKDIQRVNDRWAFALKEWHYPARAVH